MNLTEFAISISVLLVFISIRLAPESFSKSSEVENEQINNSEMVAKERVKTIYDISVDNYGHIFSYLNSSELTSLMSTSKTLKRIANESIKKYLLFLSPKLSFENLNLNRLIYSFIVKYFPGIETIKDLNYPLKIEITLDENKKRNILISIIMKYIISVVIKVLIGELEKSMIDSSFPFDNDEHNPLLWASKFGHNKIVTLLFEKVVDFNVNVNVRDKYGRTALIRASMYCHTEIVRLLLEKDADVNVVDEDGRTALIRASMYCNTEIVRLLLEKGVNVNVDVRDNFRRTALIWASMNGYTEIVRFLLKKGANVNIIDNDKRTALIRASKFGYTDIVRLLFEKGVDVDVDARDKYGRTALIWASMNGHTEIVRLLLKNNANDSIHDNYVNPREYGRTALSWASMNGHTKIVRLLKVKSLLGA